MQMIAFILLALGAFVSVANFYLSFVRYGVHRLRGGTAENYRHASGVPVFGSLFLIVAAVMLRDSPTWFWVSVALIPIDTGGVLWFLAMMFWHEWSRRG